MYECYIWFNEATFYFFQLLGLKKELQDHYDWILENFGNYSMSDVIDRCTSDVLVTTPSNHTVCGLQGRVLSYLLSKFDIRWYEKENGAQLSVLVVK